MRLQLLRFGEGVELGNGKVTAIEIENCHLFTRVVRALLSEQGKDAVEPYQLWDDTGKAVSPKKSLVVLHSLPVVPYDNKTLLGKLWTKVSRLIEGDDECERLLYGLGAQISNVVEDVGIALWGNYAFEQAWSLEQHLKAFEFKPVCGETETLLENCIRFFGLCADADQSMPVVMVNAKSFFEQNELKELYSQAVFLGTTLVILDSRHDTTCYELERKMVIDQDFLVT